MDFGHAIAIDGDRLAISESDRDRQRHPGRRRGLRIRPLGRDLVVADAAHRAGHSRERQLRFQPRVARRHTDRRCGLESGRRRDDAFPQRQALHLHEGRRFLVQPEGARHSIAPPAGAWRSTTGGSCLLRQADRRSSTYFGATYIFEKTGASWSQVGVVKGSRSGTGSRFYGSSVALNKDTLLVGGTLTPL